MISSIAQKTGGSIRKVCVVLGWPRSSFYQAAAPTATELSEAASGERDRSGLPAPSKALWLIAALAQNSPIVAWSALRPEPSAARQPLTFSSK